MRDHTVHNLDISNIVLSSVAVVLILFFPASPPPARAQDATTTSVQKSFATPELAVEALVSSVNAEPESVLGILGPDAQRIVSSGDSVADQAARERFSNAYAEGHKVERDGENRAVLILGNDDYPFPIPLVKEGEVWRFDTKVGEEEILDRRIGSNELHAIEVMGAYVEAQREYAAKDWDGHGPQYARRLLSQEGQKDGLHWPASDENDESPLGPLIAEAQDAGYDASGGSAAPRAFHGYLYRILYSQGPSAPGGERDYVVNDRMIGGFALIAFPAEYGNSGVMTFIVSDDGSVFEKDLGPETEKLASEVSAFEPDNSWSRVAKP